MNSPVDETEMNDLPHAEIRHRRRLGLVWLIPIVAAVIAAGLAVMAITSKGPTITIRFESAEGLEADKTRIRHKDVEVGKVTAVKLSEDLSHVVVTAEMDPDMTPYLTINTRFWIVRARVSVGQITGLTTLFSGVYIGMEPSREGSEATQFRALDAPPVVTMDMPGRFFQLRSEGLGWLAIGSPVYYRQIDVGQVVSYDIDPTGSTVNLRVFIRAPYDKHVGKQTRFWDASGFNLRLDASGINIDATSVVTLMVGGISFGTPDGLHPGEPADAEDMFWLYRSRSLINEPDKARRIYFVSWFDQSVRGLAVGAPVEFRGIKVGEVTDLQLEFNPQEISFRIPVVLAIDPQRLSIIGTETVSQESIIKKLIKMGLRAQLRSGILLTGQMYVDLGFYPDAPAPTPANTQYKGPYPELPTIASPQADMAASVGRLLSRLESLPIDQIGKDLQVSTARIRSLFASDDLPQAIAALNQGLSQLQRFTDRLNSELSPQLSGILSQARETLAQAEQSLQSTSRLTGPDSPLNYGLQQTLDELSRAARAVGTLADYLERNPQALIFGKGSK